MSTERDLPRIVQAWLHEDAHEYGDRVLDRVIDLLDSTPQRPASWLARRFQIMNNTFVRYGLAAAAVVVVAIIGFQLIRGSNQGGPTPTATPQPSATPEPQSPLGLPIGSQHVLWDAPGDIKISVTIAHSLWFGDVGGGVIVKDNNPYAPSGAGLIVFQGPLYVYGDPCHWATTLPETPATTAAEIVAALQAQPMRGSSGAPFDTTAGGLPASVIRLTVPGDINFDDCDESEFRSWVGDPEADSARFHQDPGQIDMVWVVDDNGTPVVFDAGSYPGTPTAYTDEMESMVQSAVLEMP